MHTITCTECHGLGSLYYVEHDTGQFVDGPCSACDGYGVEYVDVDSVPTMLDYDTDGYDAAYADDMAEHYNYPHTY